MRIPAELQGQLDKLEPVIRAAFEAAIADVRSAAQRAALEAALRDRNISLAFQVLGLSPEFYAPLDDAIRAAYLEGGRAALAGVPALTTPFPASGLPSASKAGTPKPNDGCVIIPLPLLRK